MLGDFTGHGLPAVLGSLPLSRTLSIHGKQAGELPCLGHIHIDIKHQVLKQGGELSIKVLDSGAGFDSDAVIQRNADQDCGCGLSLVEQLSESITFTENGRCINVVYAYH